MKYLILFIAILSTAILFADTVVFPGDVSGNWTSVNSPYLVEGEITIPDGETLSIEAGVIVEFQGHYKFHVQGRLLAIGTISDNIVFTINDTTGFHDFNLQEGAWQGIRFNNTPTTNDSSKIVYSRIEYGKANGFDPPCSGNGGGIYVENFSKLLIQNCEIYHNMAMLGGGIALDESNGVTIYNTLISDNESWLDGGGMYCYQSSPILDEVLLQGNNASGGGGIACWYDSSPLITNTSFINNNGTVHGGGIYCKFDSSPSLTDVVFRENTSSYGAAMNFNDESNPWIIRALITDNYSTNSSGAFSCGYDSYPVIINSTISNNTAITAGVSYIYDSHPIFVNTIIWNNSPEAFYFSDWEEFNNSITFAYSDVQGGIDDIINSEYATINWLEGNIESDPMFNDPYFNDFTLVSGSPCIDTGTSFFEWNNETMVDMSTDEYIGIAPDMGVFEFEATDVSDELIVKNAGIILSNYPNPFNPETTIYFSTTESTESLELVIYNLKGQRVKLISINQFTDSPVHQVIWNGTDDNNKPVASGVYLYKLKTGKFEKVNKMILMK